MRPGTVVASRFVARTHTIGATRTPLLALAVTAALLSPTDGAGARQSVELLVSADWLSERLDDPGVVVLHADMRRDGYAAGHIPGAGWLDMTRLVWDGDADWGTELRAPAEIEDALEVAGVSDGDHVVVYADNPLYASRAFMTLEVMGLRGRVSMLDGGWGGWRQDGRAVSTTEPATERGDVSLRPRDDIVVSADWINERLDATGVALVDARPDDEYTGADGGLGGNAGHIPGAHQMYWEELVESRPVPRVHDVDRLRRLFEAAGAETGDTVVAYCMVGWRASFTYFTARMLGYDTKFYDGSWRDWGSREDLPYVLGASPRQR